MFTRCCSSPGRSVEPLTRETMNPEERARIDRDELQGLTGWDVQNLGGLNAHAVPGYGMYVGRSPNAAVTSAGDGPTYAIPSADPGWST